MRDSPRSVGKQVSALEARLRRFARVRAVAWNVASATLVFAFVASRIGIDAPKAVVVAAWVVVAASGLGASLVAYGLLPGLLERLRATALSLPISASALKSALEFEAGTFPADSADLAEAHIRRVASALDAFDAETHVPASRLAKWPVGAAVLVWAVVFFGARHDERVIEGAHRMFGYDPVARAEVVPEVRVARGPTVEWIAPTEGREIDELEVVQLKARIADDASPIMQAELVVFVPGGRERRVPISLEGKRPFATRLEVETSFVAGSFGVRPGSRVAVRIEAKSAASDVAGRSPTLRFVVRRSGPPERAIDPPMRAIRDELVERLGDRLAPSPPAALAALRAREGTLNPAVRELAQRAKAAATELRSASNGAPASATLTTLDAIVSELEDMFVESARMKRSGALAALVSFDARATVVLEDLALRVDDLITQSALREAGESARNVRDMQQEMRRLLDELRRSPNEQTRRELLNAIREMRAAMRELADTLGELSTSVPSEYTNADAEDAQSMSSMLDALEQSLESGDLDGAEQALAGLDRQSSELDESLRDGRQAFSRERGTVGEEPGDESASGDMRDGDGPSERVDLEALRGTAGAAERRRRLLEALGKPSDPHYREATREYLEGRLR